MNGWLLVLAILLGAATVWLVRSAPHGRLRPTFRIGVLPGIVAAVARTRRTVPGGPTC
ncbi:MAG TPA: hypothetical protein VFO01_07680 [Trebonia sp.]|nr:hypothetical protein [Trebonia sp.]